MISIIIPTFNRELFLKKAIDSILAQTYQEFELIIVDDGSTDKTCGLVANYQDKRIKYIKQENKGPAAARNLGIKKAESAIVAFLDSDDWWDKDKLSIQLQEMNSQPTYLISHTDELWYKKGKLLNQKKIHRKSHGYIFDKCLKLCSVSMSTTMVRKELFNRIGYFDEALRCCEDYDFWLRASVGHSYLFINKPLTLKDGGRDDQVSYVHRVGLDRFRIYAIANILDSTGLSTEHRQAAYKELVKKCKIYGNGCLKHGKNEEALRYFSLIDKYAVNK